MSKEEDQIFFKNFSLSLGFIAVMMVVFFVVAQYAASDDEADAKMRSTKVAKLTKPVGQVTPLGEEIEVIIEEVVDIKGSNIFESIKVGDRFVTPIKKLEDAKKRFFYTPKGKK